MFKSSGRRLPITKDLLLTSPSDQKSVIIPGISRQPKLIGSDKRRTMKLNNKGDTSFNVHQNKRVGGKSVNRSDVQAWLRRGKK